jgi:hypothetical protein
MHLQFESDNYEGARALILLYSTTKATFCANNLRFYGWNGAAPFGGDDSIGA